ncbi:uncharacterized protein METZ01_LOCUS164320, partial [marine metagenome]
MQHILRIIGIALHYKSRLIAAYLCTAGALVAYVFLPYFFGKAIDEIATHLRVGEGSVPSSAILTSVAIIMALGVIRG